MSGLDDGDLDDGDRSHYEGSGEPESLVCGDTAPPQRPDVPAPPDHAWGMQLNLKTLYVGKDTCSFDFLALLAMEKSFAVVIYVNDDIAPTAGHDSVPQLLMALAHASVSAMADNENTNEDFDPFHDYSAFGDHPNRSIYSILWAITFQTMYNPSDGHEAWGMASYTKQVLPSCFVFTRVHKCIINIGPQLGAVRASRHETVYTALIDLNINDNKGNVDQVIVGCVYVNPSAIADGWTEGYTEYDHLDAIGEEPKREGCDILTTFAEELVTQGARILTGFFGNCHDSLPKIT